MGLSDVTGMICCYFDYPSVRIPLIHQIWDSNNCSIIIIGLYSVIMFSPTPCNNCMPIISQGYYVVEWLVCALTQVKLDTYVSDTYSFANSWWAWVPSISTHPSDIPDWLWKAGLLCKKLRNWICSVLLNHFSAPVLWTREQYLLGAILFLFFFQWCLDQGSN